MRSTKVAALAVGLVSVAGLALGAGLYTNGVPPAGGSQYPSTIPLTGAETVPADTNLGGGLNPATEAVTTAQMASFAGPNGAPRNFLLNGDMGVTQNGTADTTGGSTSIAISAMAADRWFVNTNVTSGAGHGQVITSSPTLPTGFTNELKIWRNSGALTQQVCAIQEIETTRAKELAGKQVVLSGWFAKLAGLTAAGNQINAYLITGTGTDEGLATLTASPAITPAWTGIAGGVTPAATFTLTATMTRFASNTVAVPSTATEVGVEICFTPVGSSSGATDGFAMTGIQLEPVQATTAGLNVGASPFEFRPLDNQLREAQRFFWVLSEPASGAGVPGFCQATGANTNACTIYLPVAMRGTTPTVTITTAGTFKVNIAGTPTTIATPAAGTCSTTACTVTAANTNTAGQAEQLTGGGGSGKWTFVNDVVM